MKLMMLVKKEVYAWYMALSFVLLLKFAESIVPQEEVYAMEQILSSMGATNWRFNGESCQLDAISQLPKLNQEAVADVQCSCNNGSSTNNCHVVSIKHKFYSLGGVLPPALVKLPYLQTIEFAYNYLNGTIPAEWGSMRLQSISLVGNRLTGEIPPELGNITTLTSLHLEANQFSGTIPSELGRLIRLESLVLSSNRLTGTLPTSFAALRNLTNFRINDNFLSGPIPDLIQNWRQLTRLELVGTGMQGPIPSSISLLGNLTILRICDLSGPTQGFPPFNNAIGILELVLRNCNISGEIPSYIWHMSNLQLLDVSFNRLVGEISGDLGRIPRLFLTGNMLSGNVPETLLQGASIDLSYNNFSWQGPDQPACRPNMNLYLNLFRSSSTGNMLRDTLPCETDIVCHKYECSIHVNSGGNDLKVKEGNVEVLYEGDASFDGDSASYHRRSTSSNWGLSSTGDFLDDNIQTGVYIESLQGSTTNLPPLYTTSRTSPLSITYVSYCLENGEYLVDLHFAEIQFTEDATYRSLGRRLFDIYIQGQRVRRDFNIENEAGGVQKPLVVPFNASVVNNVLEIRFYWAGKGTTRFPKRGVYGPLVSAISVNPHFGTCSIDGKKNNIGVYIGFALEALCVAFLILAALWWKGCLKCTQRKDKEELELNTRSFSLEQLTIATSNFDATNKIGEGGFGPVYKGRLPDGTLIAVKQLSSRSRQGNREFVNEIAMISCLKHPNLVKICGCCIDGDQPMLVYEYMENNSLANALFGSNDSRLILDWPTRFKICIGIAKGLAFLHEESRIKIVHRDIKATNVLLDKDLNPKISDFGLARLNDDDKTHISTRVAGTIGYMAPEYALWGHLSDKADVYSFGIVALEIVSSRNNNAYIPTKQCMCLLDWACKLHACKRYDELFDEKLGSEISKEEAESVVKVAILCTNGSPSMRPTMSKVVSMLEGATSVPEIVPETNGHLQFETMSERQSQTQYFSTSQTSEGCGNQSQYSTTSFDDCFDIHPVDS